MALTLQKEIAINRTVAAVCLTLLTLGFGHSTHAQSDGANDIYLWPVLTVDKDESGSDVRFLIPLGQFTEKDGKKVQALRPFYIRKSADDGSHSLDIVWPLVKFARDARGTFHSAFPFIWKADADGERLAAVFPLLWTWWNKNRSSDEKWGVVIVPAWSVQQYGDGAEWSRGLAPLCWAWRNEEAHGFWFAPVFWEKNATGSEDGAFGVLPAYFDWRRGDERGTWVMPVYWQRDGDELEALAVAPFYWRGKDSQVVFPFYWSFDEGKYKVFFPVYGRVEGADSEWLMAMWPAYMRETKGDYRKHRVLWPFLTWGGDGADRSEFALWPLYGEKQDQGEYQNGQRWTKDRTYALWPFVWRGSSQRTWKDPRRRDTDYFNVFPFYWTEKSETWRLSETGEPVEQVGQKHRNWLVPLYTYDEKNGGKAFTMLWPLWRNASSEEQDQYSVLWRVLDARFQPNGDHRVSVLWRGYRNEKKDDTLKVDMFPFMSYRRTAADSRRFQFLAGFFELGSESGKRHLRLLYLPKISLGGK